MHKLVGGMARLAQYNFCCLRILRRRLCIADSRGMCTNKTSSNGKSDEEMNDAAKIRDAYKQLDNMDFMTATKILVTTPPKRKKFGLDFHLVQLFFCCLPSLAVYLVALYSRREMRKMEAELELKRKAEEEAKAKEMARIAAEEKLRGPEAQISEVKERLDKLENVIKAIAIDTKIGSPSNKTMEETSASPNAKLPSDSRNPNPSNEAKSDAASPTKINNNKDPKTIDANTNATKTSKPVEPSG